MVLNNDISTSDAIAVEPVPITPGERVIIRYKGFLSDGQAQDIYAHIGYGPNDNWQDVQDVKLQNSFNGWQGTVDIKHGGRFNICFKDNNSRWDNNYGHNWSYEIHNGSRR
jgi:hypothetical protein